MMVALAITLAVVTSGVPDALRTAVDDHECSTDCAASFGTHHCPPRCTDGACAKAAPAVTSVHVPDNLLPDVGVAAEIALAPVLPVLATHVFHPPRR